MREWFRDEKFWRDMASRAIAGLIVTATTSLVALAWIAATGILPSINWSVVLNATGWVSALIGVSLAIGINGMIMSAPSREALRARWGEVRLATAVALPLCAYGITVLWVTGSTAQVSRLLEGSGAH